MKKLIAIMTIGIVLTANAFAETEGERPKRPNPEALAAKLIADFDTDGSATLNEEELAEALVFMRENRPRPQNRPEMKQRREPPPPEKVAERMLENHDADGDALLSEEELVEALSSMPRPGRRPGGPRSQQG
ncbi:MAG: hypothetical protein AB3N64_08915 [Puniceicoccaceae bacterium]